MGRELKRVSLDFNWPLNKVWDGYLNPHHKPCPNPDCQNGSTSARAIAAAVIDLILLAGADAATPEAARTRRIWPHPYLREIGCQSFTSVSPDAAELSTALAGRAPSLFGHDCCDSGAALRKLIKAAGLPKQWGICPTCKGHAIDPAVRRKYERWKQKEPPTGEGYQLWETVTEGSPISPVLATADAMISWLVKEGYSFEAASQFVNEDGWAPSMVITGGKVYNDIESAAIAPEGR